MLHRVTSKAHQRTYPGVPYRVTLPCLPWCAVQDAPALGRTLSLLREEGYLWTPYGLRSLSANRWGMGVRALGWKFDSTLSFQEYCDAARCWHTLQQCFQTVATADLLSYQCQVLPLIVIISILLLLPWQHHVHETQHGA